MFPVIGTSYCGGASEAPDRENRSFCCCQYIVPRYWSGIQRPGRSRPLCLGYFLLASIGRRLLYTHGTFQSTKISDRSGRSTKGTTFSVSLWRLASPEPINMMWQKANNRYLVRLDIIITPLRDHFRVSEHMKHS